MGWKRVKEHYRIVHQVHVTDKGICIGSPYISDIIVIRADGVILKRYDDGRSNEDLARYQSEMDADLATLRALIDEQDTFSSSITVFTYDGANVIEKQCETPGWPNVTHDGYLMYENTFSTDKAKIVKEAKDNADIGIKWGRENVANAEEKLLECRKRLAQEEADRIKLEIDYPSTK